MTKLRCRMVHYSMTNSVFLDDKSSRFYSVEQGEWRNDLIPWAEWSGLSSALIVMELYILWRCPAIKFKYFWGSCSFTCTCGLEKTANQPLRLPIYHMMWPPQSLLSQGRIQNNKLPHLTEQREAGRTEANRQRNSVRLSC